MEGRKNIADQNSRTMLIEVGGHRIAFRDCHVFAEIGNLPANILDYVLKTADGMFVRLTVGANSNRPGDVLGTSDGWYSANLIDEEQANQWRASWAVLREQPKTASGPWA